MSEDEELIEEEITSLKKRVKELESLVNMIILQYNKHRHGSRFPMTGPKEKVSMSSVPYETTEDIQLE